MGLLVDGKWVDQWYDTKSTGGKFVRSDAQLRNWITPDGSPGPSGEGGFAAEPGRYHLYVSLACPWAHRTLIFRALKGLQDMISVSVVNPLMAENGWTFDPAPGVVPDPVDNADYLYQVYQRARPDYSGRVTVPVLWDLERNTIVNNESAEIIRMLNSAFDGVGATPGDYAPAELLEQIDQTNSHVYDTINNGVYKAGFATAQDVYEREVTALFESLEGLEERLSRQRYLTGDRITEADWRLFTTLIRFDAVYHGHFKCNLRRLSDFPNLWAYTRELYQWSGVAQTLDLQHIKEHYYRSHGTINPNGIVPKGPALDLDAPHGRAE
ncbi:glutathione S-transferase family protein [Novilysobacter spongiicola]|uniref:Putative glutathione S-transferase n=1 Tax=Lysobacter spongiicola DSM 21749 TaxID=1122188 RepID=A0A1T4M0H1_9GAMM|nr:glutathione S-transferase family protein [Lysobacter spongiicola]SJZ60387.1 putative glutathione S-transferase [Lysobacter spongiicola DSM 21749]